MSQVADRRWSFTHRSGLEVLAPEVPGADVVVTTRHGGVSSPPFDTLNLGDHVGDDPDAVAENRRRLATAMGVGAESLAIARQEHGTKVAHATAGGSLGVADVVATADSRVAVGIVVADCVPVVVCDPVARVLVVAHAGWRGTAARVAHVAVAAARELGADADRCVAALGPCISQMAYQVGDEVAVALRAAGCAHALVSDGPGHFRADLRAANVAHLLDAGLRPENVTTAPEYTDGGTRFFSDRALRPCGRFALAARLTGTQP